MDAKEIQLRAPRHAEHAGAAHAPATGSTDGPGPHLSHTGSAPEFLVVDQQHFRDQLNRTSFSFSHLLSDHPLLQLPRLSRLAALVARDPKHFYHMAGEVRMDLGWARSLPALPLDECVLRIADLNSWVILKHCEQDPEYLDLMHQCMREFGEASGWEVARETAAWELQVMVTSPHQLTPYHIDNECNFLFQIAGNKTISIFDQTDRSILTDQELEGFWANDQNAAKLKPGSQERAKNYQLSSGKAVHLPVNAPHWVKNGANVSISVSINCELVRDRAARVFQANYYLRKLGLTPLPPGESALRDTLKYAALEGAKRVKNALLKPLRLAQ